MVQEGDMASIRAVDLYRILSLAGDSIRLTNRRPSGEELVALRAGCLALGVPTPEWLEWHTAGAEGTTSNA